MQPARARRGQRGQGMAEYTIAVALIALVVVGLIQVVGRMANNVFCNVSGGTSGHGVVAGGPSDWGLNTYGEIGNGSTTDSYSPVATKGGTCLVAVSGGAETVLGLDTDGTVWAWGANDYGQLGTGSDSGPSTCSTFGCSMAPVKVPGISGVTAVAGGYDSMALRSDGTVWMWGMNFRGELGIGNHTGPSTCTIGPYACALVPAVVPGLTGITAIANGYVNMLGGGETSMALKNDGTVWGWGANFYGELGDGTTAERDSPVQVAGLTGVTAIATGDTSFALKSDGTVWAWGHGTLGALGNGGVSNSLSPVQVSGLTGVVAISGSFETGYALKSDGKVWAWGYNTDGEVGDNTTTQRNSPVQVSGLSGITAISGGPMHAMALKNDGTVWGWGENYYGELGNGNKTGPTTCSARACSTVPLQVTPYGAANRASGISAAWYGSVVFSQEPVS